jgi:integrase
MGMLPSRSTLGTNSTTKTLLRPSLKTALRGRGLLRFSAKLPINIDRGGSAAQVSGFGIEDSGFATYLSWAHEKGVPGKVIAQLMGHAKVDTTLNVYAPVVDGSLRRAAETVGSELFSILHKPEPASQLTH